LNPDQHSQHRSGSREPNQCGSETLKKKVKRKHAINAPTKMDILLGAKWLILYGIFIMRKDADQ
jgi:hypothetical protein